MNNVIENSELEIKSKLFAQAVENGELDHLIHETVDQKLKRQLHKLADDAFKADSKSDPYLQNFQSIICMVHTMVYEDRLNELCQVMKTNFPEYYI